MAKNWFKSVRCNCKSRGKDDVYHSLITKSTRPNRISTRPTRISTRPTRISTRPKPKPKKNTKGHVWLSELEEGHQSRKMVEILFDIRWGPEGFPGRVEKVFKIHNPTRLTARFEKYRELVKLRAGPGSGARFHCTTAMMDGNEMMRFHCATDMMNGSDDATSSPVVSSTYFGSGVAHHSVADTAGLGRRAMVVSRVIAGRVVKRVGLVEPIVDKGFDSVEGDNGELVVSNSSAVLPCFLVVYTL